MKIKFVGKSFGVEGLTNGKIYDEKVENEMMYRVVDDSGEDYLYSRTDPGPLDGSSPTSK